MKMTILTWTNDCCRVNPLCSEAWRHLRSSGRNDWKYGPMNCMKIACYLRSRTCTRISRNGQRCRFSLNNWCCDLGTGIGHVPHRRNLFRNSYHSLRISLLCLSPHCHSCSGETNRRRTSQGPNSSRSYIPLPTNCRNSYLFPHHMPVIKKKNKLREANHITIIN